ncbi:MAG TPA: peroxide stress protein YaaA [Polyangiaceae bacterium]|nr:peroxide stress protein YaaA [Polyangiaceae bacterium]
MLAVLSPAKSLDLSPPKVRLEATQPALMDQAAQLMRTTRGLSQTKIRALMNISPALAKLNYDRYRSFELPFDEHNATPAATTFAGEVYRGLDARSLSAEDLTWSQDRIAILSGMFGLLRPLDLVQPYRLEMGTRLATRRGKNLYQFWGSRIAERVNEMLAEHTDKTLVNLASNEYFKAIKKKQLEGPLLHIVFEDWKDDARSPNVISFMAKHARGRMARFIIEERVDTAAQLRDFNYDRYEFQPDRSSDDRLVFGRVFIPVSKR